MQAFGLEAYPASLVPRLATMESMQAFLHVEVASPKVSLPEVAPPESEFGQDQMHGQLKALRAVILKCSPPASDQLKD